MCSARVRLIGGLLCGSGSLSRINQVTWESVGFGYGVAWCCIFNDICLLY